MQFGLTASDVDTICQILERYSPIKTAKIFGSRAKGTYKNGSDVDIALEGVKIPPDIVREISLILNEEALMPYHFDVVDFEMIQSLQLKEHIERVGIVFYNSREYS
ncbi:MAG: nucleotidyltransferase domain-containing protein [Ignavibacteriales bacterium]|nr:nucleotidyltransferase domain-containing protein [Ignavibacteriales bacterium]